MNDHTGHRTNLERRIEEAERREAAEAEREAMAAAAAAESARLRGPVVPPESEAWLSRFAPADRERIVHAAWRLSRLLTA